MEDEMSRRLRFSEVQVNCCVNGRRGGECDTV